MTSGSLIGTKVIKGMVEWVEIENRDESRDVYRTYVVTRGEDTKVNRVLW